MAGHPHEALATIKRGAHEGGPIVVRDSVTCSAIFADAELPGKTVGIDLLYEGQETGVGDEPTFSKPVQGGNIDVVPTRGNGDPEKRQDRIRDLGRFPTVGNASGVSLR